MYRVMDSLQATAAPVFCILLYVFNMNLSSVKYLYIHNVHIHTCTMLT